MREGEFLSSGGLACTGGALPASPGKAREVCFEDQAAAISQTYGGQRWLKWGDPRGGGALGSLPLAQLAALLLLEILLP